MYMYYVHKLKSLIANKCIILYNYLPTPLILNSKFLITKSGTVLHFVAETCINNKVVLYALANVLSRSS